LLSFGDSLQRARCCTRRRSSRKPCFNEENNNCGGEKPWSERHTVERSSHWQIRGISALHGDAWRRGYRSLGRWRVGDNGVATFK
jgi:hypothetical protein